MAASMGKHGLIDRRTWIKNTVRSLLDSQGLSMLHRARAWTIMAIANIGSFGPDHRAGSW
jgi:hypothetical protein